MRAGGRERERARRPERTSDAAPRLTPSAARPPLPRRRYYGSWVEGDPPHLHILLEFCDGGDLQQAIRAAREARSFFSEDLVTSWFCQLASAILFCHRRRVLHRDLKAGNIFLHGPGRVIKLADFGIARVLHSEGSLAQTVIGTPYYMSPELVNNEPYSYKSDVWSLGCVLYELASLKHAFDAGNMCGALLNMRRRGACGPQGGRRAGAALRISAH